jgi:hypothetical protein
MTTLVSKPRRAARSAGLRDVLRVRVELWIAVVCMALAFGAGIALSGVSQPASSPASTTAVDAGTFPFAPPLTDQQIEQGLPAGHPGLADEQIGGKGKKGSNDASGGGTAETGDGGGTGAT